MFGITILKFYAYTDSEIATTFPSFEFSENLSFLFMIFYFFGALFPGQSLPVIHQPWLFILGKMEAFIRVFRIISGNLCFCQNIRKIENKILFLHEYTFRKNNLDQVLTKKKNSKIPLI